MIYTYTSLSMESGSINPLLRRTGNPGSVGSNGTIYVGGVVISENPTEIITLLSTMGACKKALIAAAIGLICIIVYNVVSIFQMLLLMK